MKSGQTLTGSISLTGFVCTVHVHVFFFFEKRMSLDGSGNIESILSNHTRLDFLSRRLHYIQ